MKAGIEKQRALFLWTAMCLNELGSAFIKILGNTGKLVFSSIKMC